ncbi:MAG: endonuclease domain-containing protein [Candidatus Nomurabacteria bacterium]|nr:MAG: endonuclease domain-containing protein [Candidatus Nomurabacteria bacterium]
MQYKITDRRLKERRRELRKNATNEERDLWHYLRGRKLGGYKFLRQFSINRFIVDFYCAQYRVAIEIDGSQHASDQGATYDVERTAILSEFGVTTIRFTNNDINKRIGYVIKTITDTITEAANSSSSSFSSSREGERLIEASASVLP